MKEVKLNILHLVDSLSIGGAERMLVDIANSTSEHHNIFVCVTRESAVLSTDLNGNVGLLVLGRKRRLEWRAIQNLRSFILEHRIDIIHVHSRSSFAFVSLIKFLKFINQPVIMHDHYGEIDLNDTIPYWFRLWSKRYVTQYVGVSESLAHWAYQAGIPSQKISIISNGIDIKRFDIKESVNLREKFSISSEKLIGIVVGRLHYQKGIDLLLDILTESVQRDRYIILFAGSKRENSYYELCLNKIAELHLNNNVIFIDEQRDIPHIIRGADFALMPSRSESGPLVLIEYMLAGLPFVSFRVGNISQQAAQLGIQGFVDFGETKCFSKELDSLVSCSSSERAARGEHGRAIARQYFDIRNKRAEWYTVYNKALENK